MTGWSPGELSSFEPRSAALTGEVLGLTGGLGTFVYF
jgi:hypothetical protein